MKISESYAGFLEAEDLPEGKDIEVKIEAVREATAKDKGQDGKPLDKPIVSLVGVKKQWVMNKTNAVIIRRSLGNETDAWINKKITIYRTKCLAFGKTVACIRVREEMNNNV